MLFLTATHLRALDASTGTLLWSHSWPTYDGVIAATPLFVAPDRVFLSADYDQGAVLLQVRPEASGFTVAELWRNKAMKNHFNNSVLQAGDALRLRQLPAQGRGGVERIWTRVLFH